MRLEPIENPSSIRTKLAYLFIKRQIGKVITPVKVVYARVPKSLKLSWAMASLQESGLELDQETRLLVQGHVAALNDCAFCVDIGQAIAHSKGISSAKFRALSDYRKSPLFIERQRAALRYVEEATKHKVVSDETFNALRQHFNDREIAEITLLNAIENFYNLINIPLEIESDGLCMLQGRSPAVMTEMSSESR